MVVSQNIFKCIGAEQCPNGESSYGHENDATYRERTDRPSQSGENFLPHSMKRIIADDADAATGKRPLCRTGSQSR